MLAYKNTNTGLPITLTVIDNNCFSTNVHLFYSLSNVNAAFKNINLKSPTNYFDNIQDSSIIPSLKLWWFVLKDPMSYNLNSRNFLCIAFMVMQGNVAVNVFMRNRHRRHNLLNLSPSFGCFISNLPFLQLHCDTHFLRALFDEKFVLTSNILFAKLTSSKISI